MATPMTVPYFAFGDAPVEVKRLWGDAIERVIGSNRYIGGPEVADFEARFAEYCEAAHCVGVGNGLDALAVSLEALGIGRGHRVAVPGHTFIATWLAVLQVGAEPVGVDVDASGQLDVAAVTRLDPPPDAVIAVHMHGAAVDMPRLMGWASVTGAVVVEDCAQSHGGRIEGRPLGSWGDAGAFSFYPTKNLGALGDAGAVVTSRTDVAQRVREVGNYGADHRDKYRHVRIGRNSRLDPVQAAVLGANLTALDDWNERRAQVANRYLEALSRGTGDAVPLVPSVDDSVWHHFVVQHPRRDAYRAALLDRGVQTEVHYPFSAASEIAKARGREEPSLPQSSRLAQTVVSLPLHQWMTEEAVDHVARLLAGDALSVR